MADSFSGRQLAGEFLKGAGALGLATAAWPLSICGGSGGTQVSPRPSASLVTLTTTSIKHVIVDMQENRSFDHYFGFAPFVGKYGVFRTATRSPTDMVDR